MDSVFTYVVRRLNVVLARKSIKGWAGEGGQGRLVELWGRLRKGRMRLKKRVEATYWIILTESSSQFQTSDLRTWQRLEGMDNFAFFTRKHLHHSFAISDGDLEYKLRHQIPNRITYLFVLTSLVFHTRMKLLTVWIEFPAKFIWFF